MPSPGKDEITRSTFDAGAVAIANAPLGTVRQVRIDVVCIGAAGTTVDWALQSADGQGVGPSGTTACDGPGDHVGADLAGTVPARVKVDLQPGVGATAAYALLSRDG